MLRPKKTEEGCRLKRNVEMYGNVELPCDIMSKCRLALYGHLARMNMKRLTRKVLDNSNLSGKSYNKWKFENWFRKN